MDNKNLRNNKPVENMAHKNSKLKKTNYKVFNIISTALFVLAHIIVILAIILSYRYYSIYPSIFVSAVGIILCIMAIIDIIFFVGFNHKDFALKIIASVLSLFIFIGGTVGNYYLIKVNGAVDSVLDGNGSNAVETYSGAFVTTDKNIKSLKDLASKKIGFLVESSDGLSTIGRGLLSQEKVDYIDVQYDSNAELIQALIKKEVDAIVITSGYRGMYANDENSDIKDHLDTFIDFYTFEQDVKIKTTKPKKDITKEPFNVLLIGYSRTDWGSSVGLADAIIVATINPQTYTVSMMSIARDSFVPITCYGGSYDKINSGRSTSRACFIETVQNFIGMDIDYYMEADYEAIVYMVDALDGVYIDNPVAFELDGYYVPEGHILANGWQALEFCRERHHMPNGDFDRQQHQKEVIIEIARKLIKSGDASKGLTIMRGISQWFSTDFTFQELSSIFNLLLNTRNNTSLDTFSLVDFHTLRITGYGGIMYYSYSMHLPLWVYLIYQGSYDESIAHINDVMGKYTTINQDNSFEFSAREPYERAPFYSLEYEDKFMYQPDPMPPFWANLTGMQMSEALQWAASNGVTLTVKNILVDDAKYKASLDGQVVDQSVNYGQLISEYKSGTITVMGTGEIDPSKQVPNFVGKNYNEVVSWTRDYEVYRDTSYDTVDDNNQVGKVISQTPTAGTPIEQCRENGGISVKVGVRRFDANQLNGMSEAQVRTWVSENLVNGAEINVVKVDEQNVDRVTSVEVGDEGLFTYSTGVIITVQKSKSRYTATFVLGNGEANVVRSGVLEGTVPEKPADPIRNGYTFAGWSPSVEGIYGDTTYTAVWNENTHTVSDVDVSSVTGEKNITEEETDNASLVGKTLCTVTYSDIEPTKQIGVASCILYKAPAQSSGQETSSPESTTPSEASSETPSETPTSGE